LAGRRNKGGRNWKTAGGILGVLALFGSKLKFLLPLLKFGKFGATIWTMALSVGAYMLIYPWSFAFGLVIMLFIHEMGHVWAAKRKKLPVSAPAFIPFLGALISMKKQPQNAEVEAYIALGGPLIGTLGALAALLIGLATDHPVFYAVAMIGFFLNLINLLPIHPLDGGRIVTAISRWLWVVGLIGGLIVILYLKALIFLFFWALFAWELYNKYVRKKGRKKVEAPFQRERFMLSVPVQRFEENGVFIPAAEHQRPLPFVQVGDVREKEEKLVIGYPGFETLAQIPFNRGLVQQVALQQSAVSDDVVQMTLLLGYEPYVEYQGMIKEEPYYEVPRRTRWAYGFVYFGLAAALGLLMYYTSISIPTPPLAG
jgi:Zn-dependent protease